MTSVQQPPRTSSPRRPALERTTAMTLAAGENARFLAVIRRLGREDWLAPTDCPAWNVRDLVGHVVGMAELAASVPEQLRQMRAAGKAGGLFIDALTALQVAKHAGRTSDDLVARYAVIGPKAATGRRRTPGFIRSRAIGQPQYVGGVPETWTVGFLVDVILTRDTWMHRIDVAQAAGQQLELTPEHDGVLVADVVAEWAARHGQPCTLRLTGPAGGSWSFGAGGPALSEDAVTFCRGLSGRGAAALDTEVPF
jgi:uncharacterized protein (TIGR03083 family)